MLLSAKRAVLTRVYIDTTHVDLPLARLAVKDTLSPLDQRLIIIEALMGEW